MSQRSKEITSVERKSDIKRGVFPCVLIQRDSCVNVACQWHVLAFHMCCLVPLDPQN